MIQKTPSPIVDAPTQARTAFTTSRHLDFFSVKELTAQIGHPRSAWPLVLVKELIDNALDACEEANIAPAIKITVDEGGLTVCDNGPGIPPEVISGILNFEVRISSREAYVSPSRGAQGNALKTVVAMPFVLHGEQGKVTISARGLRHEIMVRVDRLRQKPVIEHIRHEDALVQNGTSITVHSSSSSAGTNDLFLQIEDDQRLDDDEDSTSSFPEIKARFVGLADDFTVVNPHVELKLDWFGHCLLDVKPTDSTWDKWRPSNPTSPHWYEPEHFARLVSAMLSHDLAHGHQRTVRELISQFRGLATSAKQKVILDVTKLSRATLRALMNADGLSLSEPVLKQLLNEMKSASKPVKPEQLGFIGKEHLAAKFQTLNCEMDSFNYQRAIGSTNGLPWIVEVAFAWCPDAEKRRIITGVIR